MVILVIFSYGLAEKLQISILFFLVTILNVDDLLVCHHLNSKYM